MLCRLPPDNLNQVLRAIWSPTCHFEREQAWGADRQRGAGAADRALPGRSNLVDQQPHPGRSHSLQRMTAWRSRPRAFCRRISVGKKWSCLSFQLKRVA